MPLKRKPTPTPDGNMLVIQLLNTLKSNADKTTKSILAESKLPFKF